MTMQFFLHNVFNMSDMPIEKRFYSMNEMYSGISAAGTLAYYFIIYITKGFAESLKRQLSSYFKCKGYSILRTL